MIEAIEAMREGFIQLSSGEAVIPQRIHTDMHKHNSTVLFMPAYLPDKNISGIKVVSIANDNVQKGLPLVNGLVLVIDASTGVPLAIMDGTYLTALRTGAGSGLATELLARENASTVAVFGAGPQGKTQLEAVCAVRNIKNALIFDPNKPKAEEYANEMAEKLGIAISIPIDSSELHKADIICTATTSSKPVFDSNNISQGTHINAIGSYNLKMREIPAEIVMRSKVVVDSINACLTEAGEFLLKLDPDRKIEDLIHAELGQIAGKIKPGRESEEEITFFKSVGNAVQDLSAAACIYEKTERLNLGKVIEL